MIEGPGITAVIDISPHMCTQTTNPGGDRTSDHVTHVADTSRNFTGGPALAAPLPTKPPGHGVEEGGSAL